MMPADSAAIAQPVEDRRARAEAAENAILEAIESADWTELPGWRAVRELGDNLEPESLMVYAVSADFDDGTVMVPADLSVRVGEEEGDLAMTFPATIVLRDKGNNRFELTDLKIITTRLD